MKIIETTIFPGENVITLPQFSKVVGVHLNADGDVLLDCLIDEQSPPSEYKVWVYTQADTIDLCSLTRCVGVVRPNSGPVYVFAKLDEYGTEFAFAGFA